MKKVIMMLLGIAFAGAAWAAFGDIYSIIPLSEGGKGYMTGETVKFRVRLVARNYGTPNPTAYQLVYTGSGTEAEDKVSNPLQLGIVVSGQLRGATITEVKPAEISGDPTVNPYTDLICEYVVQSGDTASLIMLALNGSTESAPIIPDSVDAVNDFGYCFINGDKWDLRIEGQTTSASLRFVSSSTVDMAKGFWPQLGATVLDEDLAMDNFVDYNLAEANFLVNSQGPFIVSPLEGEFFGFVSVLDGFKLPLLLGASDADLHEDAGGFHVKITSGGNMLYEKEDILFRKGEPTDIEINEGYKYDPENIYRTATITVKTPDGRVTTGTFTFGVLPKGGVLVHDLDEINAAIGKAEEEENYPLVLVKANVIALETGDSIALPTPDTNVNVYFSSVNCDEDLFDISAIVPNFGSPYDVVTNFADSNLVYLDPELEWSDSADDWVIVGYDTTNVLTTVEQQLAQFINTNDVAKLVHDAKRQTISLIGRGESEDYPWILDASTNVTAWVDANKKLVIDNGLLANSYDIDLVAMTNNFAKCKYTAPANALVKVVNGGTTNTVTSKGWVGANGAYATLADAIAAREAKILPGYEVVYEANGAAGSMTNSIFAVGKDSTLKANAFSAVGYDFDGWTLGTNTTVIADSATVKDLASVDGSATLNAQWSLNADGVTEVSFEALTNTVATAGLQKTNLPITIDFTSEVVIPTNAVLSAFPSGTGFSGIRYVPEEEGYSMLSVSNGVLYASTVREEVTVDALVLMQHAMGGSIPSFQAVSEGETTVTNAVVMLLGDDGKAYFNDTDDVDEMIADILAADPRPTTVKLYEVKGAMVTFEAMGGTIEDGTDPLGNDYAGGGETVTYLCLPDSGYQLPTTERTGYMFAGWFDSWKPDANEVTNNQEIVDYSEHSLYAQWISTAPTPKAGELHVEDVTNDVPVTEIAAKAYVNQADITTVTTPLYLKTIGNRAFMGCTALGKLTITATRDYETLEPTKVTIEQNAFSGCTALEELMIAGEIEKIGQSAFQNCAKLKKIIFRGDEAIAYDPGAFYRCGYANGTDELKVYMSSAFQAANAQLISDFQAWNTQVKIIDKIGVEPVTGETTVSIDPTGLIAGKRVAIVVQTSVKGTPDKEDVDIELSTDLATWTPITEGVEKTAYPDGTVMIEITVPNAPSAFFRAVVKEN